MLCPNCEAVNKIVDAYGEEIYEHKEHLFTVKQLIESHRMLREWNIKNNEDNRKMRKDMRNQAHKDAYENAIKYDWISTERLANMTMKEVCELVSGLCD